MTTWKDVTVYVGIDPATKCGWAVLDAKGNALAGGTWQLERRSGDGAGMLYVRFQKLFRELIRSMDDQEDIVVCYEQQANRFAGSAHVGLGIISHIQRICEEEDVPCTGVAFSVVKKHATGKGNSGKDAMIEAAKARWGTVEDDNHADAIWIADTVREGLV